MQNKCLAAIDMGTNSFHLIIVKVSDDGSFKVIDREREVIRLGSHKGEDLSFISHEEIERAVEVLSGFKKLADAYKAKVRAVATSAVREASNKEDFIKTVLDKTGIIVEAIEGHHEALLIFLGAKKALKLHNKKALCVDIGGGSTEIILGNNGKPLFAESLKIGAVRLSKKFFPDFKISDEAVQKCESYIEHQINSNENFSFREKFEIAVGSSGTIQSVASMLKYRLEGKINKSLNGYSFDALQLKKITDEILKANTIQERQKIVGIDKKRADILPAGLIILNKIFELFKLKNMTISEYALREGIILEMLGEERKN